MQNQPEYAQAEKKPRKRLEGKGQRRLTARGEPVQQPQDIKGSSLTLPRQNQAYMNTQGDPRPAHYPGTGDSTAQQDLQIRSDSYPAAKIPPAEVYRYDATSTLTLFVSLVIFCIRPDSVP